jgi:hypothetical protein
MLARRLVRHSLIGDGGSLGEGGPIARRPSPDRNRRRACRAPTTSLVVAPTSQDVATDLNARSQGRKAAKQITTAKFLVPNSQCLRPIHRTCGLSAKFFLLRSLSSLLFRFPLDFLGPHCRTYRSFQLSCVRHYDPLQIHKILKYTNNCCYFPVVFGRDGAGNESGGGRRWIEAGCVKCNNLSHECVRL